MTTKQITVPDMGGFEDVEIIEVSVKPGDSVALDDPLVVLESDKASMEVPATAAGKVVRLLVAVGDRVSEGSPIVEVEVAEEAGDSAETGSVAPPSADTPSKTESPPASPEAHEAAAATPSSDATSLETISVPDMGGFEDVEIIEVNVAPGDRVAQDDPLIVLETDKASMEVPSTAAGKVARLLVNAGDRVNEGSPILELEVAGGAPTSVSPRAGESTGESAGESAENKAPEKPAETATVAPTPAPAVTPVPEKSTAEAPSPVQRPLVHAGPAARRLARELGVDLSEVTGSGPHNRILKDDLKAFVKTRMQSPAAPATPTGGTTPALVLPDFSRFGEVSRKPLDRIGRLTATNMSRSWQTIPHVTQFDTADITDLEGFRKQLKAEAASRDIKLSVLPFILKACGAALTQMPDFNVSLDDATQEVVQRHYVHIGIAVDTPAGLMVPVVRDVDKKGIWDLARECGELAAKAQALKLGPADMQGGCFTVTSLGGIGGTAFTPIVNWPEVAILGVSRAAMKPVWQDGEFVPRLQLPLSLSYDHRVINGAAAARFTDCLGDLLGDVRRLLL